MLYYNLKGKVMSNTFEIGDIVRKTSGKRPLRILRDLGYDKYECKYIHSNLIIYDCGYNLVHCEEGNEMTSTNTLYKVVVDGREFYGVHVGTDSQGRMIVEEKGNGNAIHAITKDQAEEVVPFTFSVRMKGRDHHFQGDAEKVKAGDILLYTGNGADDFQIALVKNVNTKNKAAKTWKGKRLTVEDM